MRPNQLLCATGLFALATLGACNNPFGLDADLLNGTWAEEGEVPGSSEIWNLSVDGVHVTGTGTWSGEACCGGTLAIDGQIRDGRIYLGIKRTGSPVVPPTQETQFVAILRSPFEMSASLQSNPADEFRMRRQH